MIGSRRSHRPLVYALFSFASATIIAAMAPADEGRDAAEQPAAAPADQANKKIGGGMKAVTRTADEVAVLAGDLVAQIAALTSGDELDDPDDPAVQQQLVTYRPWLQVELSFANRVCKFDDAQRKAVVAASLAALKRYVRDQARQMPDRRNLGVMLLDNGMVVQQDSGVFEAKLAQFVLDGVEAAGTAEQVEAFRRESDARKNFRREADVDGLVAVLDEQLLLSDEQRQAIAGALQEKWNESWSSQLAQLTHNREYFPASIPNKCITPHLTDQQQSRWQQMPKIRFGNAGLQQFQGMLGGAIEVIDDVPVEASP